MQEIHKVKFMAALSKIKEYDMYYSQILFDKLILPDYFEVLIEYGVYKPENMARKFVYSLSYLNRIMKQNSSFIVDNQKSIINILVKGFSSIKDKQFDSYLSYYPNQLWEIFLQNIEFISEEDYSKIEKVLVHSDYLMFKLKEYINLINKSKYSTRLLGYILREVKYRRLLNEELAPINLFSDTAKIDAIFEVMCDTELDYSSVMYRSSIYMRDYDKESSIILASASLLKVKSIFEKFVIKTTTEVIKKHFHIMKLIFRVLKENSELINIIDPVLNQMETVNTLLSSGKFREEIKFYFQLSSGNHIIFMNEINKIYKDKIDEFSVYEYKAYKNLFEGNLNKKQNEFFKSRISSMSYYDSSKDSPLTFEQMKIMKISEIILVFKKTDERWYSTNEIFISFLQSEAEDKKTEVFESINYMTLGMIRDVLVLYSKDNEEKEFLSKYINKLFEAVFTNFNDIGLFNVRNILEIYKKYLDKTTINLIKQIFSTNFSKLYDQAIEDFTSDKKMDIEDIINKYINIRLGYLFEIRNLIINFDNYDKDIDTLIIKKLMSVKMEEFQSYILGANILHFVDSYPELIEQYKAIKRKNINWFYEGYINHFRLFYDNSDFVVEYVKEDLKTIYKYVLSKNYAIPTLSTYYTVIYANKLDNLNFKEIFSNEAILENIVSTYHNTPPEEKLERDIYELIEFVSKIKGNLTPHVLERIIIALDKDEHIVLPKNTLNNLNLIIENRIITFDNYWQGYRIFDFLGKISVGQTSIESIIKFIDLIIQKDIECEYLVDYLIKVEKKYSQNDFAKIYNNIQKSRKANHWLIKYKERKKALHLVN